MIMGTYTRFFINFFLSSWYPLYSLNGSQSVCFLVRVHDIMKRDSNKDPVSYPIASLAKVLIGQVVFPLNSFIYLFLLNGKRLMFFFTSKV